MVNVSKICFSHPKRTNSFVICHHFFPSTFQKKLLGELLFLIEIKIPQDLTKRYLDLAEEITGIIINGLRTNYYSEELSKKEDPEEIFESSLQRLNRLLYQEIIGSKSFKILIKNLKAVIGLIHEDKAYFSSVGSIKVFILKKKRIIDLVSQEIPFNYSKIFSQIMSGILEKDDALFFSTENFLDYFALDKLNDIVSKSSPAEAMKKVEGVLENLKDKISVAAFLIKRGEEKPEKKEIEKKEEIQLPPIEKIPVKIKISSEKEETKEIPVKETHTPPLETKKLELPEKKPMPTPEPEKLPKIKRARISFAFLKNLSFLLPKIKITSLLIIILAGLLVGLSIKTQKIKEKETLNFLLSLEEIQEKTALLKITGLVGDRKEILALAKEIEEKIISLQPKNRLEREILKRINDGFQKSLDGVYFIQRIKDLKTTFDFSREKIKPENIVQLGNSFFSSDEKTGQIYQLNLETKKISELAKIAEKDIKFKIFDPENLIIYNNQRIYLLNLKNKKISPLKLEILEKDFSIKDLLVYDNKLYILNSKTNQILKYLPSEAGFAKESLWLKEKIDLKDVVSFAIDGSIYLLKNSGELSKFFLGRKQPFSLENIYPDLIKPTKVYTNKDMRNIYILEPTGKRILVFDKSGKLQKQIFSEEFNDLKDFIIDEKETKIWLLNDSKIFEIDLK